MARYVDGFVLPIKKDRLEDYKKLARLACKVWKEHGATDYVECVADDVEVGKRTSFPRSVKLMDDEVVVFAYIGYKSRAERDRVNKKAMNDPRLAHMEHAKDMPFDAKRMYWGGFKTFVDE
jgi:uncharacterized protein YbaA (DUF1428 family)